MWLTTCDGQYSTLKWTPEMKVKLGRLGGDNIACESPFGRAGWINDLLLNALSSTVNGTVVGAQCGLLRHVSEDLSLEQLLGLLEFVKSHRDRYQEEDKLALSLQKRCKEEKLAASLARLMSKLEEKNLIRSSLQCTQRVRTERQLAEALRGLDSDIKRINFLKTQIRILTVVGGQKEEKGVDKFSKKGDPAFGGTTNLTNRFRSLLARTTTFPSYYEVAPLSADELLEDDAEHSGFTLMADYKEHGARITAGSAAIMRDLQERNATYLPRDLIFGWAEVDVFTWRRPLTSQQAQFRVGRVFTDLDTDEELVVRGLYYDDANDDVVLYLHLVSDLTRGEITTGVMKPRETLHCDQSMFGAQQIAEKWRIRWTGREFRTTLSG